MNIGLADVFITASKMKTKKEKIEYLKQNRTPELTKVLVATYDRRLDWALPEGTPPYTPTKKEYDLQNVLKKDIRLLYIFIKCPQSEGLRQYKRENIFIELLERVDPDDAKLLLGMKDRKLPYEGITENLIREAFPDLDKEWPKKEKAAS